MARPAKPRDSGSSAPTEAELTLLNWLWSHGPATVREIWEGLGSKGSYTTVLKQCQVMHEKGLVLRDESERTHVYRAALPRQKVRRSILGKLVDQVFEGSAAQLVLGALSAKRVSAEERAEIRRMLDEMEDDDATGSAASSK
jgi:BlaI family penicillinase repressor